MTHHAQDQNIPIGTDELEHLDFSEHFANHKSLLADETARVVLSIREYCYQYREGLKQLPQLALDANLNYPKCDGRQFMLNHILYTSRLLPLKSISCEATGVDGPIGIKSLWLSLDTTNAELVTCWTNSDLHYDDFGFKRGSSARGDYIYKLADYFAQGNLPNAIHQLKQAASGELSCYEGAIAQNQSLDRETYELGQTVKRLLAKASDRPSDNESRSSLAELIRSRLRNISEI